MADGRPIIRAGDLVVIQNQEGFRSWLNGRPAVVVSCEQGPFTPGFYYIVNLLVPALWIFRRFRVEDWPNPEGVRRATPLEVLGRIT